MSKIEIGGRSVGDGAPCYVIAEAGVNHNGDLALGRKLVDAAADAGADAVKFQTYTTERVTVREAPKAQYQIETTGASESQFDMLKRLELDEAGHRELLRRAHERGIQFISTPFDELSADFLESLGVPAFKIPSGEITNHPFLAHVAKKGKPMIVSTGTASLAEVSAALNAIRAAGPTPLAVLHCVSAYPAAPADANLRAMKTMADAFGVPIGYSDHTLGATVSLAAAALGASIIEKHLTLDRQLPGPDHRASLEPGEMKDMIDGIRTIASALGHGRKEPTLAEADVAAVSRKSIVSARQIPAGTVIAIDDLVMKNPGSGISPASLDQVLGKVTLQEIPADTILTLGMFR